MNSQIIFHPGALDERDGEFVQLGSKCRDCGKTSYPATELCQFCSSENLDIQPLSTEGTVFSYTVTRVPVAHYKPPIICGYIDLPEGARVFGQIHANVDEVKIGMRVKMMTGVIWTENDGTEVFGYYYVPSNVDCGGDKS